MSVLLTLLRPLGLFNATVLRLGSWIAITALALMVLFILAQVVFRYLLNDALNWSEEAARFGMLWMTGLMAPLAYRQGGFVAIDFVQQRIASVAAEILGLVLLCLTMWVLIIAWDKGLNNHIDTLSGRGCSSTLRWPFGIEIGKCGNKFANQYQYASLWVGINLLILVNVELILRQLVVLMGGGNQLPDISGDATARAD